MSLNANDFLKQLQETKNRTKEPLLKMATVTKVEAGKPYLTFYGEDTQSEKGYKILSSYNPIAGDTVCLVNINGSWLVLGKITEQYSGSSSEVPLNHASTATTYGKGTSSYYGHVKLSDSTSSTSAAASGGVAATPKAVKAAYDKAIESNKKKVASAYGSASSLSVPEKMITQITLDTWDVRSDSAFSFSEGGIKCPYEGYVLVTGNVYFKTNGSTGDCRRGAYIRKNGTEIQSQYLNFKENAEGIVGSGVSVVQVSAGDVITLNARQSTATTCAPGADSARLVVCYI